MGERITETLERIEHRGQSILYADYGGLAGDDFSNHIKLNVAAAAELAGRGEREQLGLMDVGGALFSSEVWSVIKENSRKMTPHTKADAIVGVSLIRKRLLKIVNSVTGWGGKPFDTVEEALDWLAEQGRK